MPEKVQIYLSLGSNLGDRAANLARVVGALPSNDVQVSRKSSVYETEPVDFQDQPWFLNSVIEGETVLAPQDLLLALNGITRAMGPPKQNPKGPRVIDIDILLYSDRLICTPELEIPHPRMAQRKFVLVPLAELVPNLVHPSLDRTVQELLAATPDRSELWRYPATK